MSRATEGAGPADRARARRRNQYGTTPTRHAQPFAPGAHDSPAAGATPPCTRRWAPAPSSPSRPSPLQQPRFGERGHWLETDGAAPRGRRTPRTVGAHDHRCAFSRTGTGLRVRQQQQLIQREGRTASQRERCSGQSNIGHQRGQLQSDHKLVSSRLPSANSIHWRSQQPNSSSGTVCAGDVIAMTVAGRPRRLPWTHHELRWRHP